jgi:hypothetical protein
MKTTSILIILLLTASSIAAQVFTTNTTPTGMEHNILFNANSRYQVTQTGTATFNLDMLFDGIMYPSYTSTAPSLGAPTVILIEGLPNIHTQAGTWVGWSTRYWEAKRFKIEGYDTHNGNVWKTIADYSQSDYTGGRKFITRVYSSGRYTKLRFSFYSAVGTDGRMGISELFFIHPEVDRPYAGLLASENPTNGNQNINGDLEVIGDVNIGGTKNHTMKIRHIEGKDYDSADYSNLYLNYKSGADVVVGKIGEQSSDLFVAGKIGVGTTSPSANLQIGDGTSDTSLRVYHSDNSYTSLNGYGLFFNRVWSYMRPTNNGINNLYVGHNDRHWKTVNTSANLAIRYYNADGEVARWDMANGRLGIGTASPSEKLSVNGRIRAKEVKVEVENWPDYVFASDYKLPTLSSLAAYIKENGHLPDIPTAAEVAEQGLSIGEANAKLLKKIEELTLYTLEQEEILQKQQQQLENLHKNQEKLLLLQAKLSQIESQLNRNETNKNP